MTDAQDPRPSLAELRARKASLISGLIGMTEAERDALLDIAEAARLVAHEAEFYADDDTPDGSLIVVPRDDMKKLDEALAKVAP